MLRIYANERAMYETTTCVFSTTKDADSNHSTTLPSPKVLPTYPV